MAELLQFASVYQAGQLRRTCQQYIALNLGCLLEAKALEVLEKDVLQELTDAYREMVSVGRKVIWNQSWNFQICLAVQNCPSVWD